MAIIYPGHEPRKCSLVCEQPCAAACRPACASPRFVVQEDLLPGVRTCTGYSHIRKTGSEPTNAKEETIIINSDSTTVREYIIYIN